MTGISYKLYSYHFYNRFVGIIWAGVYVVIGALLTVWGFAKVGSISFDEQQIFGLSIIWGIITFLVFLAYILGRRFTIILSPILLTKQGIKAELRKNSYEHWPQHNSAFIAWNEIDKLEYFNFPDMDAMKMVKRSGIRLLSGDGKIVIYENINKYLELLETIKSKIDISKIDPEVKMSFYDKRGRPKTL